MCLQIPRCLNESVTTNLKLVILKDTQEYRAQQILLHLLVELFFFISGHMDIMPQ